MIYLLLTLISFTAKLYLYKVAKNNYVKGSEFHFIIKVFILILVAQSGFELSLYYFSDAPQTAAALYSLNGYYLCLFLVINCLPFLGLYSAGKTINIYLTVISVAVIGAISVILLTTDLIIAGVKAEAATMSLTKVDGEWYWVFQVSAIVSLLFTFTTLIKEHYLRSNDFFLRARCANLLIAFLPTVIFGISIIFAMHLGMQVNAVGILPFCFLVYVLALINNMNLKRIPDYTIFLPFSQKNKMLFNRMRDLLYLQSNKEIKEKSDAELINYYLNKGMTQKQVAEIIGCSEATLSRRKNVSRVRYKDR